VAALRFAPQGRGQLVLDSGALSALAAGNLNARAAMLLASRRDLDVVVPAVVLAQVIRGGPQDAAVNRILKGVDDYVPITIPLARQAGVLLQKTATTDVVGALVAPVALQQLPARILTSDPDDLCTLVMTDSAHSRVQIIAI
jgi:hypothetical protein